MAAVAAAIQSTAGAIPVINEKGEVSMQKVKVHRYVSGKRPEYAPSSGEESDEDFPFEKKKHYKQPEPSEALLRVEKDDPRLKRLMGHKAHEQTSEERIERHRHIHAPEIVATAEDEQQEIIREERKRWRDEEESSDDEELDEEEIEKRRNVLKQRRVQVAVNEELLDVEDEAKSEAESEETSEYEEYTDSEEETGPRLKPVFVRKRDRITIQEKEKQELRQKELEVDAKRIVEERKKHTLKLVEDEAKKELAQRNGGVVDPSDAIKTDDENDEVEYESWKARELKRIKRDRDEREAHEKERLEIERVHTMTEEERRLDQRNNPKHVTNKGVKGKYKFLQKYFHRGAFFMDYETDVFKRDFSQPTLEDHFDKTILPKVMQVKNFGRSGRTKYTHLVDQDTTQFDSPWVQETAQNLKFHANNAGGMKQVFDRPSTFKRKK